MPWPMKQTRKGKQYYFGMKAHVGVDAVTGLTHSVAARRSTIKKMEDSPMKALLLEFEKAKATGAVTG